MIKPPILVGITPAFPLPSLLHAFEENKSTAIVRFDGEGRTYYLRIRDGRVVQGGHQRLEPGAMHRRVVALFKKLLEGEFEFSVFDVPVSVSRSDEGLTISRLLLDSARAADEAADPLPDQEERLAARSF